MHINHRPVMRGVSFPRLLSVYSVGLAWAVYVISTARASYASCSRCSASPSTAFVRGWIPPLGDSGKDSRTPPYRSVFFPRGEPPAVASWLPFHVDDEATNSASLHISDLWCGAGEKTRGLFDELSKSPWQDRFELRGIYPLIRDDDRQTRYTSGKLLPPLSFVRADPVQWTMYRLYKHSSTQETQLMTPRKQHVEWFVFQDPLYNLNALEQSVLVHIWHQMIGLPGVDDLHVSFRLDKDARRHEEDARRIIDVAEEMNRACRYDMENFPERGVVWTPSYFEKSGELWITLSAVHNKKDES